jgi:hypothetical protein
MDSKKERQFFAAYGFGFLRDRQMSIIIQVLV